MSSSLKYKKVYVDTKFMTPDSKSTSDFSIELPETMYFDNNSSVFYIDDITIPHSWYTVEKDVNDKLYLYLAEQTTGSNPVTLESWSYIVTLTPNFYTGGSLATHLKTILNASVKGTGKPLPANSLINPFNATYDQTVNTITITMLSTAMRPQKFTILSSIDLKTGFNGLFAQYYDKTNPRDCNELIGNTENISQVSQLFSEDGIKGFINLQPFRNLYMHSSALGNLSNIGPDGSQTVIKKIPVTAEFGSYIYDQTFMYNDYNSCSGQTLKKLDFQFKSSRGDIIPLHGVHVSFSIIFSRAQPDA